MYNITFSINIEVCGQFIYELSYFLISILLKLALTVVKGVFCDVNCVKCKFQSSDTLKSSNANIKAKIINSNFQHLLYYNSERKYFKH